MDKVTLTIPKNNQAAYEVIAYHTGDYTVRLLTDNAIHLHWLTRHMEQIYTLIAPHHDDYVEEVFDVDGWDMGKVERLIRVFEARQAEREGL